MAELSWRISSTNDRQRCLLLYYFFCITLVSSLLCLLSSPALIVVSVSGEFAPPLPEVDGGFVPSSTSSTSAEEEGIENTAVQFNDDMITVQVPVDATSGSNEAYQFQSTNSMPSSGGSSPTEGKSSASSPARPAELLCKCGHHLATTQDLVVVRSPAALKLHHIALPVSRDPTAAYASEAPSTESILYPVQRFRNPGGHEFDVVCVKPSAQSAMAYRVSPQATAHATWFHEYSWRIVGCHKCGNHLGWYYEKEPSQQQQQMKSDISLEQFYGLIVDNIQMKTVETHLDATIVTLAKLNQTVVKEGEEQ